MITCTLPNPAPFFLLSSGPPQREALEGRPGEIRTEEECNYLGAEGERGFARVRVRWIATRSANPPCHPDRNGKTAVLKPAVLKYDPFDSGQGQFYNPSLCFRPPPRPAPPWEESDNGQCHVAPVPPSSFFSRSLLLPPVTTCYILHLHGILILYRLRPWPTLSH